MNALVNPARQGGIFVSYYLMVLKKRKNNKDKILIEELKEKVKSCEAELVKLKEYLHEVEAKMIDIVRQMHDSRDRDKELRKKIEILLKQMQNRW